MTHMIPEEKITEIKAKANIVEVISDFVSLKKAGKNHLGLCPFHSEKTPSFTVNEEKGIFHCFGCGAGGNIFNFVMQTQKVSFPEAARELAKRCGVTLPQRELSPEERRVRTLKGKLYDVNESAAECFHQVLTSRKEGEEGRKYLAQRGISGEIISAHRLGFAPAGWDFLLTWLQNKGVPLNLAESLGLIQRRQDRSGYYDRFRDRVMFPIINEGGKVIGFGGRILPGADSGAPKYMNSSESAVYSKGQTLYGLNAAREAIREQGFALIVEGYMDLLSLHQEGIKNVVASLGTSLTPAQVELLVRYAREIILVFDADEGGKKGTQRSLDIFLSRGTAAKVVTLPAGFDPDSFIREKKREGFDVILAGALPVVDYILEQAVRNFSRDTIEGKVRIAREMIPVLNQLQDPIERNLYIERISTRLGVKESLVRNQLKGGQSTIEDAAPGRSSSPGPVYERVLLQLMLLDGSVIPKVQDVLGKEGFSFPLYRELGREIAQVWQSAGKLDPQILLPRLADEELKSLISELLLEEERIVDADRMLSDCLRQVRLNRILREIKSVDDEIRQRSQEGKDAAAGASGLKELLRRKLRLKAEQRKWMDSAFGLQPPAGQ